MISKRSTAFLALAVLGLAACQGGDNSTEEGLKIHFAETHAEGTEAHAKAAVKHAGELHLPGVDNGAGGTAGAAQPSATGGAGGMGGAAGGAGGSTPPSAKGGYDHENLEHHHVTDRNGTALPLYRIYLALDHFELVPCASVATLWQTVRDGLIGSASAHGGHGNAPAASRALDKPNVIDLMAADDFVLPLGSAAVAPGRYCAVRLGLTRLAGDAYGKPTFSAPSGDDPIKDPGKPDLAGRAFAIKADYCSARAGDGTCTARSKADMDDAGLTLPAVLTLDLPQPLTLDASRRDAHVLIGIHYGGWAHNVDVTQLSSSAIERQKLLDNVAASLHIDSAGLGTSPVARQ